MQVTAVKKLVLGAGAVVALSLVGSVTAMLVSGQMSTQIERSVTIARQQALAGRISTAAADMMARARGLAFATVLQQSAEAKDARQEYEKANSQLKAALEEFKQLGESGNTADHVGELADKAGASQQSYDALVEKLQQNKMDDALEMLNTRLLPGLAAMSAAAKDLVADQGRLLAAARVEGQAMQARSLWINAGWLLASLVLGALVIVTVRRVQTMLTATVTALSSEARQLGNAAARVSSSSQALAEMVMQQATAIERAASSAANIGAQTQRNAQNAQEAAAKTEESYGRIQQANTALADMLATMNEIGSSSKKISGVIKVIDGIAFQTNILSLNASVEAARAGQAGLGFAVVADEVRGLAQRSADAARDTSSLIEESLRRSSEGQEKADEVAKSIEVVNTGARTVKALVEEVRESCQDQENGIRQVVGSMDEMRQLAHSLSSRANDGLAAGEQLSRQSETVGRIVTNLEALVASHH